MRRILISTTATIALSTIFFFSTAATQEVPVQPADETEYPVLLVHGLGEIPGEASFGKLKESLEKKRFEVEYMDFNEFADHDLASTKKRGDLGVLAAILGNKIRSMIQTYNTEKVNIVAHSYGGLIVQAYLLNFGAEHDEQKGTYEDTIHRVCYIQTPFYGIEYDEEELEELAKGTDYGPFTQPDKIMKTLEFGSNYIYNMDTLLRDENIYDETVDAVTFISRDDEVVADLFGTLNNFMIKGQTHTDHQYRIFAGKYGSYSHCMHPLSTASGYNSLAYVVNPDDPNDLAIFSFLEGGFTWRKIGGTNLDDYSILMVAYEKHPKNKKIDEDTVRLKRLNGDLAPAADASPSGKMVKGSFNSKSHVFVFPNVTPGNYKIIVKNQKNKNVSVESKIGKGENISYTFQPEDNAILKTGQVLAIVSEAEIKYTGKGEQAVYKLEGLDTDGFYISFYIENISSSIPKATIFNFYNASGPFSPDARKNGGRIEVTPRGNPGSDHYGKLTFHASVDKDHSGHIVGGDPNEYLEEKTTKTWNWKMKHHFRMTVKTLPDDRVEFKMFVDGDSIWTGHKSRPYWNPNPILVIGSRFQDGKYITPAGAIMTELVVDNLENEK